MVPRLNIIIHFELRTDLWSQSLGEYVKISTFSAEVKFIVVIIWEIIPFTISLSRRPDAFNALGTFDRPVCKKTDPVFLTREKKKITINK